MLLTSCAMRSGKYVFKLTVNGYLRKLKCWLFYIQVSLVKNTSDYDYRSVGDFMWPVPSSKKISSRFGKRGSRKHDGIDIPAQKLEVVLWPQKMAK
jgi:murein DD-endopeptidase MepM/ murein hydrolase activator NlpD